MKLHNSYYQEKITEQALNELREQIVKANKAYRIGRPVMSDQEFDNLCEEYERMIPADEYSAFRDSLHEETGKVKHPYIMGSLDKLKIEEPEKIVEWIHKYHIHTLNVSAKVDGISCRLHYDKNGHLVSATTRGDGMSGQDLTDKIKYVKEVPEHLSIGVYLGIKEFDIRGELVILKSDFEEIKDVLKNPRNACAGIMGQKEANPSMLKYISFIAYEIMGGEYEKSKQFDILDAFGFHTSKHFNLNISEVGSNEKLFEILSDCIRFSYDYPTDGIVVSSADYKAEHGVYRPKAQKAVKIANMVSGKSVLRDVVWEQPSKNGRITPVGIIDPTDIDGAVVSRVTLNNVDWFHQMGIKIDSLVTIVRSNGVIPKIIEVENTGDEMEIEIPTRCPYCGRELMMDGVDLRCMNPDCGATGFARIRSFLENIGIKHVSLKTLENLGIDDFQKLLSFKADKNYKVQVRFENDLYNAMFGSDEVSIFKALPFKNVAEKTLDKIIDFYGWEWLKSIFHGDPTNFWMFGRSGMPVGVGEKMLSSFEEYATNNFLLLDQIMNDSRWHGKSFESIMAEKENEMKSSINSENTGKSVCFTGKLENFSRSEASEFAKKHGFDVLTSVSKNLTYLVTNDKDSGSGKNKKAAQLGVKVINEDEFIAMCN